VISSGERVDVKILPQVPVYWVYVTAWGGPDGVTQFRDDIYQKDGVAAPGQAALQGRPVAQNTVGGRLLPRDDEPR